MKNRSSSPPGFIGTLYAQMERDTSSTNQFILRHIGKNYGDDEAIRKCSHKKQGYCKGWVEPKGIKTNDNHGHE